MVSYLLNIVQVDPIEYGLLFERFLDEERVGRRVKTEVVVVRGKKGERREYDVQKDIKVLRNGQIITIKAVSLEPKDQIYE